MNDIMKIVQGLEDCNILLKRDKRTKKRISKYVVGYFRRYFVRKFIRKKRNCKSWFNKQIRKRTCKSWLWKRMALLMPPHLLTNFELEKYYENKPRFNGVYSRNNLPKKIKFGAYVINLDEYADVGTR